jgi:hypothetical protein
MAEHGCLGKAQTTRRNKVRGHPVWEGCARIPTNHTSTPIPLTNSSKASQSLPPSLITMGFTSGLVRNIPLQTRISMRQTEAKLTSTPTARRLHSHNHNSLPVSQPPRAQQTAPKRASPPTSRPPQQYRRARTCAIASHKPRSPHWPSRNRQRPLERRARKECAHAAICGLDECKVEVGGQSERAVEQGVPEGEGGRCGGYEVRVKAFWSLHVPVSE